MCDTIGIIDKKNNKGWFAKNSDRSPNEKQVIEYIPSKKNSDSKLKVTYIEIEQVPQTYAMIISRPTWMWGCEMGVNEKGVCIGNEALFTKGKYNKQGLIGMDLVRLGLERGSNAKEALETIIYLLERYNQGGNCGYDHKFYYDNSFLIMDKEQLYVLETKGKEWAYKQLEKASISNEATIRIPDNSSRHFYDFKKQVQNNLYTKFSGAEKRNEQTRTILNKDNLTKQDLFKVLRSHDTNNVLTEGSVNSVCMHAGKLIGDHTTSSMVVELGDEINVYVTACSLPCLSIFKKIKWEEIDTNSYWQEREKENRLFIGSKISDQFYVEKEKIENHFMNEDLSFKEMTIAEHQFYRRWMPHIVKLNKLNKHFRKYWYKKNKQLGE